MRMTLYAADILKVAGLVGEPVMFGNDIGFFVVADELKFIDIVMTAKANIVVVSYNFIDH